MASYWPTPAARQDDPVVAELMNTLPKVVVSTTLTSADWSNSSVLGGNLAEEVTKLKQQPGRGIAIFGSPSLTVSLLELGLVDELRVLVNPIVLGDGHSLFRTARDRLRLELRQPGSSARATCCSPTGPPDSGRQSWHHRAMPALCRLPGGPGWPNPHRSRRSWA